MSGCSSGGAVPVVFDATKVATAARRSAIIASVHGGRGAGVVDRVDVQGHVDVGVRGGGLDPLEVVAGDDGVGVAVDRQPVAGMARRAAGSGLTISS